MSARWKNRNFTWESLLTLKMHVIMMNCIDCTYVLCFFSFLLWVTLWNDKGFTTGWDIKNFFLVFSIKYTWNTNVKCFAWTMFTLICSCRTRSKNIQYPDLCHQKVPKATMLNITWFGLLTNVLKKVFRLNTVLNRFQNVRKERVVVTLL